MLTKITTILTLCFTVGAMLAHALYQPAWNAVAEVAAAEEAYKQSAIIGYVQMDGMGQLYFEGAER